MSKNIYSKYIQKNLAYVTIQNFQTSLGQNVSILEQYVFEENIRTVWQINTWYSSKSLWILSNFLVWFLTPKVPNGPKPKMCPRR